MSNYRIVFKNFFLFSGLIFLLDQVSKKLVQFYWPSFLICNSQMALSLPKIDWFFFLSTAFFLIFLGWLITQNKTSLSLFLVLGGALANLFDRFSLGCVLDWIALFNFPVFNLADAAIFLGIVGFFYQKRKTLL